VTASASPVADRAPGRAIVLVLLATLAFATVEATAKTLTESLPVPQVVWGRYAFTMLVFVPWLLRGRWREVVATRRPRAQLVRSLLLLSGTITGFAGLSLMPLATVTVLFFATPLFVTAFAAPMLGERIGPRRWLGVLVGFAGVVIVVRPGGDGLGWPALLPVATAMAYALYQIVTRRVSSEPPLVSLFYAALIGALVMCAAVPFFWQAPDAQSWALMALTGLVGGLGHFLLIKAFEAASPATTAPFLYSHLIWAVVYGALLFGDLPDGWTVAGAAVIVASGIYVWHRERGAAR